MTKREQILDLVVIPGASREEITYMNGKFFLKIKAKPIRNEANKRLIYLLSKVMKMPQKNFQIMSGFRSRKKRVKIFFFDETLALDLITLLKNA